jgi:hypothetical protein
MPKISLPPKRGGRSAYQTFSVVNPGKGLNNLISDSLIDDKESSDLENIQFVESGAPSKAPGYTQVGDTLSNNPRCLGSYVDTSANRYLITVDGTALKYLNSSTWTTISGATFDSSAQINMTQAAGLLFISDGVSGMAQLSGLTLTRPTSTPKAKFSIYYNGYHMAAGVATQENRLYISTLSDASDFTNAATTLNNSTEVPGASAFAGTGANFVDINKNDGDKITGLAKFNDVLVIFKEKSVYQLTFAADGTPTVQAVTKNYGCVGHRTIENVDNDVFFLSRNGVYVLGNEPNYFNVIRTNELSSRVHTTIDTISQTYYTNATAVFFNYVYYLGIPTDSTGKNTVCLTYDKRFLAFSKWTHVKPECFTTFIDSNNMEAMYFTSNTTNKVYKMTPGSYSADGVAISCSWTSKAFDLGKFAEYKRWIDCTVYFRQFLGQVTVEILTDGGNVVKTSSISALSGGGIGSKLWGADFFGGNVSSSVSVAGTATNNVPYRIRIGTKARTIKLRISNSRNAESFTALGFEFTYRPYSHFVFPSGNKIQ